MPLLAAAALTATLRIGAIYRIISTEKERAGILHRLATNPISRNTAQISAGLLPSWTALSSHWIARAITTIFVDVADSARVLATRLAGKGRVTGGLAPNGSLTTLVSWLADRSNPTRRVFTTRITRTNTKSPARPAGRATGVGKRITRLTTRAPTAHQRRRAPSSTILLSPHIRYIE